MADRPSITGIITSISIASKVPRGLLSNTSTACCPSCTIVTTAPSSSSRVLAISAFSSLSCNLDSSIHLINKIFHNRHSESGTIVYASDICTFLGKRVKNMLQKFLIHTDSCIPDRPAVSNCSIFDSQTGAGCFYLSANLIVLDTVTVNIQEDLPDMQRTSINAIVNYTFRIFIIFQYDPGFCSTLLYDHQNIPGQLSQVHRFMEKNHFTAFQLAHLQNIESARTGRRGRPAKHGKRLSVETDFTFSNEKIGDYYIGVRRVLTKIFGNKEVLAYVTATEKEHGTKRLFFSTIFPENLQIFCAWQEKAPLNQTGSNRMEYIPLLLYSFRWNIETSYYEQKTFWSFCSYMVRSCKGIEMLVNLINISYCAMKILPYQNEHFSEYRTKSVQEFRFELSQGIRSQIFFAIFVKNIETHIKSNAMTKALKQLVCQQVYHL